MANHAFQSSQLGELPYVDESEEIIVLPGIRFPDHYKVQEWIVGTDKSAELTLVITHICDGNHMRTVAALEPANEKILFIWKLRGVKELEEEILDFYSKKTYNV